MFKAVYRPKHFAYPQRCLILARSVWDLASSQSAYVFAMNVAPSARRLVAEADQPGLQTLSHKPTPFMGGLLTSGGRRSTLSHIVYRLLVAIDITPNPPRHP
jgi:hypothetical protein